MNIKEFNNHYFITCSKGLEEILEQEVNELTSSKSKIQKGGVDFKCNEESMIEVLLKSRIGGRLYKKLSSFSIRQDRDKELYYGILDINWSKIFDHHSTIKIKVILDYSLVGQKKNSLYLSQLCKDAVCDRMIKETQKRPNVDLKRPDISLLLHLSAAKKDKIEVKVFIDLNGGPLGNRHYRSPGATAPLKENLAAGILSFTKLLDPNYNLFIDSMCGSGTVLIEALMAKGNLPPSYLKVKKNLPNLGTSDSLFSLDKIIFFRNDDHFFSKWKKANEDIIEIYQQGVNKLKNSHFTALGYDIDPQAIHRTNKHLERCQLKELVQINLADATKILPPKDHQQGILFSNPPYGQRMGEIEELKELYFQWGENIKKNFKNFEAYLFTGNLELRKEIKLKTNARIELYNGPIDCRLFNYSIF